MVSSGTLGMGPDPALGGEVHGDAGGEEAEGDGEGAEDPGELDAALEHEVVEDAEDQDQDGGFGEEGRQAAAGDADQLECAVLAGGAGGRLGEDEMKLRRGRGGQFVEHTTPL
jgi:hypothetical protein